MFTFSPALQLAPLPAAVAAPSHLSLISPARPHVPTVIVERLETTSPIGTCALCWSGPEPLAGRVHRVGADSQHTLICSRCLVTLEMLAVQFDPELWIRLHVETPA